MLMARVFDGSAWFLLQPAHLAQLRTLCAAQLSKMHADLLKQYCLGYARLADVPDDGYLYNNVGYHLVGADQLLQYQEVCLCLTSVLLH